MTSIMNRRKLGMTQQNSVKVPTSQEQWQIAPIWAPNTNFALQRGGMKERSKSFMAWWKESQLLLSLWEAAVSQVKQHCLGQIFAY